MMSSSISHPSIVQLSFESMIVRFSRKRERLGVLHFLWVIAFSLQSIGGKTAQIKARGLIAFKPLEDLRLKRL
jgi:hypothetical protein